MIQTELNKLLDNGWEIAENTDDPNYEYQEIELTNITNKDVCYGAVQQLTNFVNMYKQGEGNPGPANDGITLRQVNIHQMLCEETFDTCMELIDDIQTDPRLKDLNAVVFLIMKPKGNRNKCHQMKDLARYRTLIDKAFAAKVRIGFDSCTAPSFLRAVQDRPEYQQLKECAEPCESTCFSIYIDVHGNALPCSFCGGEPGIEPINMNEVTNFMWQVWNSKQFTGFRKKLLSSQSETGCRQCPMFDVEIK